MDWGPGIDWLRAQGFDSLPESAFDFKGVLNTKYGSAKVLIKLDEQCVAFPAVQLLSRPGWLPTHCAHIDQRQTICCMDSATSAPDRRDPAGLLQLVVASAVTLLESSVENRGNTTEEFLTMWSMTSELGYVHSDDVNETWHLAHSGPDMSWPCLVPNSRLEGVRNWLHPNHVCEAVRPIVLDLRSPPRASGPGWPVKSINDLHIWLSHFDADSNKELEAALLQIAKRIAETGIRYKICTLLRYGSQYAAVIFDPTRSLQWLATGPMRRSNRLYHHIVKTMLGPICEPGLRSKFFNIESTNVLERAMGSGAKTLAGKRIALVGAGSVGSFAAQALVRAGAGSERGLLRIFDADVVSAGNISRSAYTASDIGKVKSETLTASLQSIILDACIEAEGHFTSVSRADDVDFIVDVTGDHAFSTWLSSERAQQKIPPVLFGWIGGQGSAVVTYLQSNYRAPCLACLGVADEGSDYNVLLSQSEGRSHQVGACGQAFMPYSVAAPMMAASLIASHALDWVRNITQRSFRTIILAPESAKVVPDDPPFCEHSAAT